MLDNLRKKKQYQFRWIRCIAANLELVDYYCRKSPTAQAIRDWLIGIVAMIVACFVPRADSLWGFRSVFRFPPDWKPLGGFLLATVVGVVWWITRAWLNRLLKIKKENVVRIIFRKVIRYSVIGLMCGVLFSLTYITTYSLKVIDSRSLFSTDAPSTTQPDSTSIVFIMPITASEEFSRGWAARGGFEEVAYNDQEWLADALTREGWRVVVTKMLLIVSGLLAASSFMYTLTLATSLPKIKADNASEKFAGHAKDLADEPDTTSHHVG